MSEKFCPKAKPKGLKRTIIYVTGDVSDRLTQYAEDIGCKETTFLKEAIEYSFSDEAFMQSMEKLNNSRKHYCFRVVLDKHIRKKIEEISSNSGISVSGICAKFISNAIDNIYDGDQRSN